MLYTVVPRFIRPYTVLHKHPHACTVSKIQSVSQPEKCLTYFSGLVLKCECIAVHMLATCAHTVICEALGLPGLAQF